MSGRVLRCAGTVSALLLVVGLAGPARAATAAAARPALTAKPVRPVAGREVALLPVTPPQVDRPAPSATTWPAGGSAAVPATGRVTAGGLPVALSPVDRPASGTARVAVLDRAATGRARVDGVLLRITGTAVGRARVTVDYGRFRDVHGGDWAARLGLYRLPECGLTTPARAGCAAAPLPGRNDTRAATVSADVNLAAGAAADGGTVLALTAGASGSTGDYSATPLSPSGSWQVGSASGDFSWSYPLRLPPAPGGLAPKLALSYSSAGVDGRTASTNAQPSVVGEGWSDPSPGFIERGYRTCADDGKNTRDLCWVTDNAVLSLNGRSVPLVRDDATGGWRPRDDDGSRIERLSNLPNGSNGGQGWRITTQDGTQYSFGLHQLPGFTAGKPVTNSTWTVPVFGNNTGEPCPSSCLQAWRWNLDYVKDPHGNAIAYYYTPETNRYGSAATVYTRGGYLAHADYGFRDGQAYATGGPTGTVVFGLSDRCDPAVAGCGSFPDTPTDQTCAAAPCTAAQATPTFWVRKRLTSILTRVWRGTAFADVDQWTLTHRFPAPGDGQPAALWLDSIVHTGLVGGSIATPAVTFDPLPLQNRVDTATYPGMRKMRIGAIHTESGGVIGVTYEPAECTPTSLPAAADNNSKRCYAQWWAPAAEAPILDWFHKHVVAQVTESDPIGGSRPVETDYFYPDTPAWHFTDGDEVTPPAKRTWSTWRGYARVQIRRGSAAEGQTLTEDRFYRGMNGDHLADGSTRAAAVTDTEGTVTDDDGLGGQVREHIVYNGPGGAEVGGTIYQPYRSAATARHAHDGITVAAYQVRAGAEHDRAALAAGGERRTELTRGYDADGRLTTVDDPGDTATAADDRCATTSYATDTTRWMLSYPAEVSTVTGRCGAAPHFPDGGLSTQRTYYDGSTTLGALPAAGAGNATRADTAKAYGSTGPTAFASSGKTFDAYGRVLTQTDGLQRPTTTTYTGLPLTSSTVTDAAGNTVTTTYEPAWGVPTSTVDVNGRRTDQTYDALGRAMAVWLPDRPKATNSTGNVQFAYSLSKTAASWVRTDRLAPSSQYLTSYALFDGLLRPRETQVPAEGGGRLVTETFYDTRGQPFLAYQPYFTGGAPSGTLFTTTPTQVPSETVTGYDGAGRVTTVVSRRYDDELWRTTTAYRGDHTDVTPPAGGTATSTYADARGNTTELRQYHGGTPSGEYDATRYGYSAGGRLTSVTGPGGAHWSYRYDPLGRRTGVTGPDTGELISTFDDAGQLLTTTDARGQTLAHTYDQLGRPTAEYAGSTAGPKLAEWTYDTVPGPEGNPTKGRPATATRYDGGKAYTQQITGYDVDYRPTGQAVTLPADEPGFGALTYQTSMGYALDGSPAFHTTPAVGGLPAEILRTVYDAVALPFTLKAQGGASYVTDSLYTTYGEPSVYTLSAGTGTGAQLSYDFEDGTHRLVRSRLLRQSATDRDQADVAYSYDNAGNLTSALDTPAGQAADRQCFDYDYLRRLTEAWTPASGDCTAAPTLTTALGGAAAYWTSYRYDPTGNRTSTISHDPANTGNDTTTTYSYPAPDADQPHTLQSATTSGPSGTQTASYGYDPAGHTTSRPGPAGTQTLGWDTEGRLATVTDPTGTGTVTYDANGERLIARDPHGATLYLPDGNELRWNQATGTVTGTRYYVHNGTTVAVRTPAGVSWLAPDPHGTATRTIAAATGAVTVRRTDPFGNTRGAAPTTWPDNHGFLGAPTDTSTGLTHLGAREYDPGLGRFISADPVVDAADPQSLDGYAYADNNPTTNTDPTGEICNNGPDGSCHTDHGNIDTPGLTNQGGATDPFDRTTPHNDAAKAARDVIETQAAAHGVTGRVIPSPQIPNAAKRCMGQPAGCGYGVPDIVYQDSNGVLYVWEVKSVSQAAKAAKEAEHYVTWLRRGGSMAVVGWAIGGPYKVPTNQDWIVGPTAGVVIYGHPDRVPQPRYRPRFNDDDERPSVPTTTTAPVPDRGRPDPTPAPPLAVPGMYPGTAYQPGLGTIPLCTSGCGGGTLVGAWLVKGAGVVGGAALIIYLAPEAAAGAAIVVSSATVVRLATS